MKKHKLYFLAECIVIAALLVVIAFLLKDDKNEDMVIADFSGNVMQEAEEKVVHVVGSVQNTGNETRKERIPEDTTNTDRRVPSVEQKIEKEQQLQIVVFGDSIWNAERGENGISEQVMAATGAKIYNCAIGGTTAAVVGETTNWEEWTSKSFNGMMYIANEIVSAEELISDDVACDVIKTVDFDEVDYVIISYGLNDYFSDVPIHPKEYYDLTSYVGALRHGIQKLREEYPQLKFILTSPTYCGWFEGERQFRLGDYVEAARGVAAEFDTYFLDMFHAFGKTPMEKSKYLEDGVHLTEEGLTLYANSVIDFLNNLPKDDKE